MRSYFDRVPSVYGEAIGRAWAILPRKVLELIQPHFLCGVNPNFVGLHGYMAFDQESEKQGRGYDVVAHACYAHHSADGVPRVVLPRQKPVETIVHEFGHLFDEATHFALSPPSTTAYSLTSRAERVAEAFRYVIAPPDAEWGEFVASEAFRPFAEVVGAL